MTAVVMIAPSLLVTSSWFLIFAVAAFLFSVGVVARVHDRRLSGVLLALGFGCVAIVISDDICKAFPWLLECWCSWCV